MKATQATQQGSMKPAKQVRVWIPLSLLYCIAQKNKSLSAFINECVERALEEE